MNQFYRARYYEPTTGRFATEDPEDFASDVNFYRYVRNNPLNFIDPSGRRGKKPGASNPAPSGNAAFYICCRNGAFGICEGPMAAQGPSNAFAKDWLKKCQRKHEEQHISDLTGGMVPGMAGYCTGLPDQTTVLIPASDKNNVECSGWSQQLKCLQSGPQPLLQNEIREAEKNCGKYCGKKVK